MCTAVNNNDLLQPPFRFGMVNPGIYRGSYPCLPNFRFLSRLQLKTILSLTPEQPSADIASFTEMAGASSIHVSIIRGASLQEPLLASLLQALQIILDTRNHPIFVHCLDGRRITSLLVIILRRLQGWNSVGCFSEYWRFQVVGKPPVPTLEVEKQTREIEKFCPDPFECGLTLPENHPK